MVFISLMCYYLRKVICVLVALPASTSVNTQAEGSQRFHHADRIPMNPSHKARKNPFDNADLGFLFLHTRRLVLYLFSFISMSHTLSDMTQF